MLYGGFPDHKYDLIIISGKTAGLAIAVRSTENPNIETGVLEAGAATIDDPMIMTPALCPKIIGTSKYDWIYMGVHQNSANNVGFQQHRAKIQGALALSISKCTFEVMHLTMTT
ncbi:hypothetical protein B2J93_1103 [Marssonina coronariae]|uniref:Glucose-methanol-choline oxidoreductase N-terminal domain-containing protein n=1 Tax=Diplocarpon coronariae TaxID=2795749 RepID=A0A218YS56_9HELO|nr:hypothetical protein B2J93_1103 [Marssonina coronariae]